MKNIILIPLFILVVLSCKNTTHVSAPEEAIGALDSIGMGFFKTWGYGNKGSAIMKYWYRHANGQIDYGLQIALMAQQEEITLTYPDVFFRRYKMPFYFDQAYTSKVYRYRDSIIFTKLVISQGRYIIAGTIQKNDSLFTKVNNLVDSLNTMGRKMDRIGIHEVLTNEARIIFGLRDGKMLVRLLDNIDEARKKKETEGCVMIQPGWWIFTNTSK